MEQENSKKDRVIFMTKFVVKFFPFVIGCAILIWVLNVVKP